MKIVNLTQHPGTPEQIAAGVVDITDYRKDTLVKCLNFEGIPTLDEIHCRAEAIADIAEAEVAMIGGAPYLMSALEKELIQRGIKPVYAFSRRESVEETQPDRSVRKVAVFRHLGFVEMV